MIKAGVGKSNHPDAFEAGAKACQQAITQVGGKADLIFVFSTVAYDQKKMLEGVRSVSIKTPLVGCSTIRGIINDKGCSDCVVSMALSSDTLHFNISFGKETGKDPVGAGKMLAQDIKEKNASALIIFLESVGVNGSAVVRGIQEGLGEHFPIIGGMASDASTFTKTYQYYKDQVLVDNVVGVGLSGRFSYGIGVKHGWESIGLPVKVTKSEGSVIKELNNRPALKFFEDYFGEKAKQLEKPLSRICYVYPLGMSVEGSDELLIRNAFVATEKGEIICAGEIPQGSEIRLMLGDPGKAIEAAKEAAESAKAQLRGAEPKAIFVFNCTARYMLLGFRADEEIVVIQNVLGKDVPLIGFYTYGEQAPLGGLLGPECFSVFHNETMALLVVGE